MLNWPEVAAVAAATAAAVAVITLIFNMHHLRRTIASGTYQQLLEGFDRWCELLVRHPTVHRVIFEGLHPSDDDKIRAHWAMAMLFTWYENMILHDLEYHVLPATLRVHYLSILEEDIKSPVLRQYWRENGHFYHGLVRDEIDALLREHSLSTDRNFDSNGSQ